MNLGMPGKVMITESQIIEALHDVVSSVPAGHKAEFQMYVNVNGDPECVVGAVLRQMGLPTPSFNSLKNGIGIDELIDGALGNDGFFVSEQIEFTDRAQEVLAAAQANESEPWSEVLNEVLAMMNDGRI